MTTGTLANRVDAVVIGASAGGIEALLTVLPALARRPAAPIFIVVHLPRDRASLLANLFGARCRIPVMEAEDKMPIQAGTIYFAPSDYHLLLEKGPSLALSADDLVNYSRPSIDVLFESAVDVYGARLAAIILTGANEDGAAGFAAVGRAGGVTIAQDPATAFVSTMPLAALARAGAEFVMSPEAIAALLQTLDFPVAGKVAA